MATFNGRFEVRLPQEELDQIDDDERWLAIGSRSGLARMVMHFLHLRLNEFREQHPDASPHMMWGRDADGTDTFIFLKDYYDAKRLAQAETQREADKWLRDYQIARGLSGQAVDPNIQRVEEAILREVHRMWGKGLPVNQSWLRAGPNVEVKIVEAPAAMAALAATPAPAAAPAPPAESPLSPGPDGVVAIDEFGELVVVPAPAAPPMVQAQTTQGGLTAKQAWETFAVIVLYTLVVFVTGAVVGPWIAKLLF